MTNSSTHEFGKTDWSFCNPVRLIFGIDCLNALPEVIMARRVLFVTTPGFTRRGVTDRVRKLVDPYLVQIIDTIGPNPELDGLEGMAQELCDIRAEVIVAVGGGSVIDTAKVISTLLSRKEEELSLRNHFENNGGELQGSAIPVIAVPTTAGTGSEVTPFATVWDSVSGKKYSLSGFQLFPEVALLDPRMTVSLPRDMTVMTGLDAISQGFEAIWNRNATPITTMYGTEALRIALFTLERLAMDLDNVCLRAEMLRASTFAGLAISNARTALAHSMSYPITMHYDVPHGLACSFTLPAILRFNSEVDDGRLHELAIALRLNSVNGLHKYVTRLLDRLGVQEMLAKYLDSVEELKELVPEMLTPGRSDNNMRFAKYDNITRILRESR